MIRFAALVFALALCAPATAVRADAPVDGPHAAGYEAYEAGHYERAATLLEAALADAPDCARCAHLLGKSYGRLAEQASWMSAIALAKKTRIALEQAVALAPDDANAVADLIKYYRAAPGFLGGNPAKADALERRLLSVTG